MRMERPQSGQATIEYLGLVALLAVLLVAGSAIGAPGVANAVLGQMRHALCIVTGKRCTVDLQRPCTVASRRETRRIALSIVLVRLSRDSYVLRERLSDGTVRLTVFRRYGAGAEGGVGGRLEIDRKDEPGEVPEPKDLLKKPGAAQGVTPDARKVGVSSEARAGLEGVFGSGKVFIAQDEAQADELLRAVEDDDEALPPSEVFYEAGARGLARLGFGGLLAGGQLDGIADSTLAVREERDSGDVTITVNSGSAGWGLMTALAGPAGSFDRQVLLGLTFDRERRPVELSVLASGSVSGGTALPPGVAEALGTGGDDSASQNLTGRRWEAAARLDLTDPEVAAAWGAFRRDPASAATIAALGRQLAGRAHLDVRTYGTDTSSDGFAAAVGGGFRVGGETDRTVDRAKLLKASSRPPGGLWEQRVDCLAAVA